MRSSCIISVEIKDQSIGLKTMGIMVERYFSLQSRKRPYIRRIALISSERISNFFHEHGNLFLLFVNFLKAGYRVRYDWKKLAKPWSACGKTSPKGAMIRTKTASSWKSSWKKEGSLHKKQVLREITSPSRRKQVPCKKSRLLLKMDVSREKRDVPCEERQVSRKKRSSSWKTRFLMKEDRFLWENNKHSHDKKLADFILVTRHSLMSFRGTILAKIGVALASKSQTHELLWGIIQRFCNKSRNQEKGYHLP